MQTGFEFKKQRAIPVITGIVVAQDQEDAVLEVSNEENPVLSSSDQALKVYWESAAAAEEKAVAKKEERALKRWGKLVNGLRVRARLQAEYGEGDGVSHFVILEGRS